MIFLTLQIHICLIRLEHTVLLPHHLKRKIIRFLRDYVTFAFFVYNFGDILVCKSITLSLITRNQFSQVLTTRCVESQNICHRSRWLPKRRQSVVSSGG